MHISCLIRTLRRIRLDGHFRELLSMLNVIYKWWLNISISGKMNIPAHIYQVLDYIIQTLTYCKRDNNRVHAIYSIGKSKSGSGNVNIDCLKEFTDSRTMDTSSHTLTFHWYHLRKQMELITIHWWEQRLPSYKWWSFAHTI